MTESESDYYFFGGVLLVILLLCAFYLGSCFEQLSIKNQCRLSKNFSTYITGQDSFKCEEIKVKAVLNEEDR